MSGLIVSTYFGPGSVARGHEGGGTLPHQIREIDVASETVAGSRAPPPLPMFLEKEREGGATVL